MKKTILMFAMVVAAFSACKKDNDEPYQFKGTEMVYLNGIDKPKFKSTVKQYTVSDIVRDSLVAIRTTLFGETNSGYRYFDMWGQRDTINNRLLMKSTDILTDDGRIIYDFIGAFDVYLQITRDGMHGDTVGYIPQSIIDNARAQIESLYAQERYDEIYELFHSAFTFYTCTGEEYKQIVANGGN